jgi:hypothetical protein
MSWRPDGADIPPVGITSKCFNARLLQVPAAGTAQMLDEWQELPVVDRISKIQLSRAAH